MTPTSALDIHGQFAELPGTELLGEEFLAAFAQDFWRIGPSGFWKLEVGQVFVEPRSRSWQAFVAGDLAGAVAMHDDRREELVDYYRRVAECGFATCRIRVVDLPLTPYMRWELPLLRLRDELGGHCHVLTPDRHALLGERRPPEVCVLGDDVVYRLLYTAGGLQLGGVRYTDPALATALRRYLQTLYHSAEPIWAFAARELDLVQE